MIKIRNESDFRNWFKKNYHKLGFSKIVKSNSDCCPDFVMLRDDKEVRVELEVKSSNFYLHGHSVDDVDEIVCAIKDVDIPVPIIKIDDVEMVGVGEYAPYSFPEIVYSLFKKDEVLITSEVAKSLDINNGTAHMALLELLAENKIERIKKTGVNLWMLK